MCRVKRLSLRFFRSYETLEKTFEPKTNLIQGPNGQGKTNLLEALYFLSTGRSFRTSNLSDLIAYGKPFFYIEAEISRGSDLQTIKASFDGKQKKLQINATTYSQFSPLLGTLPTVLLCPEDSILITGAPADRRRFLDLYLSQIDPTYLEALSRYYRAMKQRNQLLRLKITSGIEAWETVMQQTAVLIQEKRNATLQKLHLETLSLLPHIHQRQRTLKLLYHPSLLQDFKTHRPRELILGTTLFGPHRDDFTFLLDGKEAKLFASQGEIRSLVAVLKLAQWHHLKQISEETLPILSIDDFGVHLDDQKKHSLLELITDLGQVFLTTADHTL